MQPLKTNHQNTVVIIPVYNEANVITQTLDSLSNIFTNIICVDDGSKDNSAKIIDATNKAKLVKHPVNFGQGAALQTGIEYALQNPETEYFITFDADGQHGEDDALKMLDYLKSHDIDIVLGSRFLGSAINIGPVKKAMLKIAIQFSNRTTGIKLTDVHNGLRVFNRKVAKELRLTMLDMAHATEIIYRISENHLRYVELPITITYSDYSKAKGQSLLNSINITFDLLLRKLSKK